MKKFMRNYIDDLKIALETLEHEKVNEISNILKEIKKKKNRFSDR